MQSQQIVYAPAPQHGQQAQIVQTQPGQTIVIHTGNPQQARLAAYDNYSYRLSIRLGLVLIVAGCLLIVLNAAAIATNDTVSTIGHGIWGGVWHILTGLLGILAGKTKKLCQIIIFMTFAILSALLALVELILFGLAAGFTTERLKQRYWYDNDWSEKVLKRGIAINAIAAIVSGVAGVVSIICAALCCSGVCCGRPSATAGFTIAQAGSSGQPTQVVYVPGTAVQPGGVGAGGPMQPLGGPTQPILTPSAPMADAPPDYATAMQEKRPM